MTRPLAVLLACLSCLAGAGHRAAFAGDPPAGGAPNEALRREVDKLLGEVASDRFEVREAAERRLTVIARPARALLTARRDDPDPQVRITVQRLLAGLGETEAGPAPPPPELADVGLVTFAGEGALSDVLRAWDAACAGRVRLPPSVAASPARVAVRGRPYFEALDALLAAARVDVGEGFDDAGEAQAGVREAPPAVAPAYAGAFRLDLEGVDAHRSFRQGPSRRYTLSFRALWSPDVQVASYTPLAVVRAEDAAGKALRSIDGGYSSASVGLGLGRRSASLPVTLDPEADASADCIAALEVKARFRVRYGRQEARFEDLSKEALPAAREVAARAGDRSGATKVTLDALAPDADFRGYAKVSVSVYLPKGVAPDGVSAVLETKDGILRSMYGSRITGADGVLHLTARLPGVTEENPAVSIRVTWYAREDEASLAFAFKDVPLR